MSLELTGAPVVVNGAANGIGAALAMACAQRGAGHVSIVVAERALDGLINGHFLIPTHYNARAYFERRDAELTEAFDRLAEIDTTDYDVGRLVGEALADMSVVNDDSGHADAR